MWMLPRTDLKYRLTLRTVAVSAACFAAASVYLLVDADRSGYAKIQTIAEIAAKDLALQQSKRDWVKGQPAAFPDLQNIATRFMEPGLCVAYRADSGDVLQRFCGGTQSEESPPPRLFAAFYRAVFDPGREAVRPVIARGRKIGEAVVSVDAATRTTDGWLGASRLFAVMALTLLLLSFLVHAALARALRPTRLIRVGLERIAANDLSARLPPFDLAELSAIRNVFNHLAESLEQALADRTELTRRLIALQDEERRRLARELHDEFGQGLTAIRALASSIEHTAAQDCPAVLRESEGIARIAADMTETLRGSLFRLRPPDIDELGLAASLEGLVAGWNGRSRGRTRFEAELGADLDRLPSTVSAGLYRIAQEAMTNATKHAEATRVVLALIIRDLHPARRDGVREIELTVRDDGRAGDAEPAVKAGMGLLGMRERVATLGGRLTFEAGRQTGSVLRVVIPLAPGTECAA